MCNELTIGRIYGRKGTVNLFRVFAGGGAGFYSVRGCTKQTAIPHNHYRAEDMYEPTIEQINWFLEQEMANGMCQTWNRQK